MLYVYRNPDAELCTDVSECCPDGFDLVGRSYRRAPLAVCLERDETHRAVLRLESLPDGSKCSYPHLECDCPDGFVPAGYYWTRDLICLEAPLQD